MSSIRSLTRCALLVVAGIGVYPSFALAMGISSIDSVEELPALSPRPDVGLPGITHNGTVHQARITLIAETQAPSGKAITGMGCPGGGSSGEDSSIGNSDHTDTHDSGSSGNIHRNDNGTMSTVHAVALNSRLVVRWVVVVLLLTMTTPSLPACPIVLLLTMLAVVVFRAVVLTVVAGPQGKVPTMVTSTVIARPRDLLPATRGTTTVTTPLATDLHHGDLMYLP
jgi:hypothetical protein